jgi:hypothetical protein
MLVSRGVLIVLNRSLDIVNSVRRFDFERVDLVDQRLDEDLHEYEGLWEVMAEQHPRTQHTEMQSALLMDVVIRKSTSIFELFAGRGRDREWNIVIGERVCVRDPVCELLSSEDKTSLVSRIPSLSWILALML